MFGRLNFWLLGGRLAKMLLDCYFSCNFLYVCLIKRKLRSTHITTEKGSPFFFILGVLVGLGGVAGGAAWEVVGFDRKARM